MRREWEPEELVASWTLVERDERELISYKHDGGRLAFSLTLKFFELEGRFPRHAGELPPAAVSYVARQVGVDPAELQRFFAFTDDRKRERAREWLAEEGYLPIGP